MTLLDKIQPRIDQVCRRLWPTSDGIENAGILCEEAGEVMQAHIKRLHQIRGEGDRQEEDWDAEVRKETAQAAVCCLKIAEREGFSLWEAILEEVGRLESRAERLGV